MNFKIACGFNHGRNTGINGPRNLYRRSRPLSQNADPEKGEIVSFATIITINPAASQQPWPRKLFCGRRLRLREPIFASSLLGWPCWQTNRPMTIYWTWHAMDMSTERISFIVLFLLFLDLLFRGKNVLRSFVLRISRVYLSANNERKEFSSRSHENKSWAFTMRNDFQWYFFLRLSC